MSKTILPPKLKRGDEIRIIAPSCSGSTIKKSILKSAQERFKKLGFIVTLSKNLFEMNNLESSSVKSRLKDLQDAFVDKNVKGIIAIRGGYNINDLLDYIDWKLIKNNPKIYCGFSDNTALQNTILTKTGLITYSGPNFATFGQPKNPGYTVKNFINAVSQIKPEPLKNFNKAIIINKGKATGAIIGGNLCTFNLLQGTQYMPSLNNTILFAEANYMSSLDWQEFTRDLQSVINLPDFKKVKALVIGRFENESKISINKIKEIIKTKPELSKIPVIANIDFGHNLPIFTFPVGSLATVDTSKKDLLSIKFI